MSNVAIDYNNFYNNNKNAVIYDFTTRKPMNKNNDDSNGKYDNKAGKSSEVFAFRTDEEIKAMIDVYNKHIENAETEYQCMIACRNKMMFIVGINVGLRASDLRTLTWDFFFTKAIDGSLQFRDSYNLCPKKTRKTKKYVKLRFNDTVKKIINWYIAIYPIDDIKEYVFKSRKGDDAVSVHSMCRIIKETAKEAGIKQNIGSHSLRRTFCRRVYDDANDKGQALLVLQKILNHSSQAVTLNYIGIMNEEIDDVFDNTNIGIDWI